MIRQTLLRFAPEVIWFGAVGVAATATHYGVMVWLVESLGLQATLSTGLAFLTALSVTYLGQSYLVFRERRHGVGRLGRFLVVALGGLAGNVSIMFVVTVLLSLSYHLGFVIALAIVPTLTYVASKIWVFEQRFGRHGDAERPAAPAEP